MSALLTSTVIVIVTAAGFAAALLWRRWIETTGELRDEARRLAVARNDELLRLTRLTDGLAGMRDFEQLRRCLAVELAPVMGTEPYCIVAWTNGRAVLLAGTPTEPAGVIPADLTNSPESAWDCFPLTGSGQPVGLMAVGRRAGGLTPDARRTLGLVASLIASAVRNVELLTRARAASMIDPLTGCLTRQFGLEALAREMSRMRRSAAVVCVAMLDLDRFKCLNDTHGHPAGDRALAAVGRILKEGLRASDIACRYGGDEFLIILPDTTPAGAARAIDNLRLRISNIGMESDMMAFDFTASVGIAAVESADDDPGAVVARADAVMYDNKRNQAAAIQATSAAISGRGVPSAVR
jgi:diguanylate cyclase (GGDEF)-like protein